MRSTSRVRLLTGILLVTILVVVLIVGTVRYVEYPPRDAFKVDKWYVISPTGDAFYDKGYFVSLTKPSDVGVFSYYALVDVEDVPCTDMYLVVSRPGFRAIRVYVNGTLMGEVGDMKRGNSNIWNGVFVYPISTSQGAISIRIEGYGLYSRGFYIPVFITSKKRAYEYLQLNYLWSQNLFVWATGMAVVLSITLFLIYLSGKIPHKKVYLYFTISMLFLALVFFDSIPIYSLFISYMVYWKFLLVSVFLAVIFTHLGMMEMLESYGKVARYLVYGAVVIMITAVLMGWEPIAFNKISSLVMFYLPVVVFYDIGMFAKAVVYEENVSIPVITLFVGILSEGVFILSDVLSKIRSLYDPSYTVYYSFYGLITSMAAIYVALVFDYILAYDKLHIERVKSHVFKEFAQRDSLTGAYNRRYLYDLAHTLTGRLCVMMLDIDHFKQVNDSYGHDAGDIVLRDIVSLIRKHLREDDILIRYGGEEFVIILRRLTPDAAKSVADRIRKSIEEYDFIVKNKYIEKLKITVSIGVVCGYVGEGASYMLWNLIKAADERMYEAKSSGRNRVVAGNLL